MYDLIYELIGSRDLLDVNINLKKIDEALERQAVNRTAFCKKLAKSLLEWTFMLRSGDLFESKKPKYYIFSAERSIPFYLTFSGLSLGRVREVRQCIKDQIAFIDEIIIAPTGNYITVETEKSVLATLDTKFPFFEVTSGIIPLHILNINNTNRHFNSTTGFNEIGMPIAIHMYNMKDSDTSPEYVLLHELGHVLQASLTQSTSLVPDEFIQLHKLLPNVRKLEQGNPAAPEVFADTFAIAVMRGTELSRCDPFDFPESLKEVFEDFYKRLFEKYRRINSEHQCS